MFLQKEQIDHFKEFLLKIKLKLVKIEICFYRLYHKDTDNAIKPGCDATCRRRVLCGIVAAHYAEYKTCIQLKPKVGGVILPPSIFTGGAEVLKRGSTSESTFQRMISFGRSLLKALG